VWRGGKNEQHRPKEPSLPRPSLPPWLSRRRRLVVPSCAARLERLAPLHLATCLLAALPRSLPALLFSAMLQNPFDWIRTMERVAGESDSDIEERDDG
jgi:hypothetical protein